MATAADGAAITLNGQTLMVQSASDTPLLYVLRDELHLHGPRFGCGLGQCGACTVLVDGQAVRSCRVPLSAIGSRQVTTLEGLGAGPGQLSTLQLAFINEQAAQCGYCTNGMIMQSAYLLANNPSPSEDDIRQGLANNLCRCGSHLAVVRAVQSAAAAMSA
jgi:nicotinate dehydrogenase subunit A